MKGVRNMSIEEYKSIYDAILDLSEDADSFGLFKTISDEDVEKCMYIAAILDTLNDVPAARKEHIFKHKKISQCQYNDWYEKMMCYN